MTDLSTASRPAPRAAKLQSAVRFVTAASLFDGHDASINIIRRMLQASGAEVIHLGHNRSVDEIVTAALQEDAHGIAVSSYHGAHIKVFGGGGGVIVQAEIKELETYGVAKIYSPEDGAAMGLQGMIDDMIGRARGNLGALAPASLDALFAGDRVALAKILTALETQV